VQVSYIQYAIIIAYFAFILTKGIRKSRSIKKADDFLVAGRSIGWFFLFCTIGATVVGGGASIGAVGRTYEWGVLMLLVSLGWYLQFVFSGLFVAPRFREANLYTVAGYFGHRFGPRSRFFAFVLSLLFSVGVLGAQMVAFGKIISTMVPQIPYVWAVLLGGVMVTVYSTAGGLWAVIHTDVYQFVILIAGFAVTLFLCVPDLLASGEELRAVVPAEFFRADGGKGWLFLLSTFLAFLLGETFSPAYATRFCVGKDIQQTKKGIVGAGIFLALVFPAILFLIALYARLYLPDIDPGQVLPQVIVHLNHPVVAGLVIAALMSAVMSSADSILNSSTAIFVKDCYEQYFPCAETGSGKGLRLARYSSVVLGALGISLALVLPDIIDVLLLTYNLWAPGIILPVLIGVFSRYRSEKTDGLVFVTMVVSTAVTLVLMFSVKEPAIQPSIVGVAVSVVVLAVGRLAKQG
jgi:SSS family solute:Na+ symporter